jgi:coenzyme PQQ biosynthesis protein PqqD
MRPSVAPRRHDDVLVQAAGDETVLLALRNGTYFSLNEVAGRVWELCDGSRSVADIVAVITDEYAATPEDIERDVVELLDDLLAEDLVTG